MYSGCFAAAGCSMLGASAGWVLPYSYQCNLMVMAAGKYKTADFIKIGLPYHVSAAAAFSSE
jgi:di/tricarboxylate transporter